MRRLLTIACPLAFLGLTCVPPHAGTQGELGNGFFLYSCVGPSDPHCDDENHSSVPTRIAVGSSFSVSYTMAVSVQPAADEMISNTSPFVALRPGTAALIGLYKAAVYDFIHLHLAEVDHLQIDELQEEFLEPVRTQIDSFELRLDETARLRIIPLDKGSNVLAGTLDCAWSIEDASIADIVEPSDNLITVQPKAAGTTTLHVALGDHTADVALTVTGGGGSSGSGGAGGAGGSGGSAGGAP